MFKGVVFDLDDTLVDTSPLRWLRDSGQWRPAVGRLNETRLFDGVDELIHKLRKRDILWAIVTTSVSYYADKLIDHFDLRGATLVAFHDATPKPSPEPIALALKRMSLKPDETIGIGDSENDLLAYRAAGLRAVGAGWSPVFYQGDWDDVVQAPQDIMTL